MIDVDAHERGLMMEYKLGPYRLTRICSKCGAHVVGVNFIQRGERFYHNRCATLMADAGALSGDNKAILIQTDKTDENTITWVSFREELAL